MAYDVVEAQAALDRLGATLTDTPERAHAAASQLLLQASRLRKPRGVQGLAYDAHHEMLEVSTTSGYCRVWYGGAKGTFMVAQREQEGTTEALNVPIAYEPVMGEFVATEYDETVAPTPGATRPKRDALALLIDAIATYLVRRNQRR